MARIPVYEQQTSPGGGFQTGLARGVDRGERAIAQGVQSMGQALNQVAQDQLNIAEERAKVQADERASEFERNWIQRHTELEVNPDVPVEGHTQYVMQEYQKFRDDFFADYPEGFERRLVEGAIRRLGDNTMNRAVAFEAQQGRAVRIERTLNSIQQSGQSVALDPNPIRAERLMGERLATIDSLKLPEGRKAELRENLRLTIGRAGADAMARQNPTEMLNQYSQARQEGADSTGNFFLDNIPSTEWNKYIEIAQASIEEASMEGTAKSAWNAVIGGEFGATIGDDQVREMHQYIDQNMRGSDQATRNAAKAMVDNMTSIYNKREQEREDAFVVDVWQQALQGNTLNNIMSSESWSQLDPNDRISLMTDITSFVTQPPSDERRHATYETLKGDPQTVAGMSQRDILQLAPVLGESYTNKLLTFRETLQQPGAFDDQAFDETQYKRISEQFGYNAFAPDENERAELGRIRAEIEIRQDDEARAKGRDLTRQEREEIIRQVFNDRVMISKMFSDEEVVFAAVEYDDLDKAYVEVDDQEIYLNEIPPSRRSVIRNEFTETGMRFSQEALAMMSVIPDQERREIIDQMKRERVIMTPELIFSVYQRANRSPEQEETSVLTRGQRENRGQMPVAP